MEEIRSSIDAVVKFTHHFFGAMISRKRGAIINHFAVYAETKAFVLSFTEAHAEEVKATGVRLLGLCPGSVNAEKCSLTTRGVLGKLPSLTAERVVTMG